MIKWQVYEPLRYKYPRCQNYECPTNEQDCHLIGGQCYFFSRQNIDYDAQQSLSATKFGALKQFFFFVINFFSFSDAVCPTSSDTNYKSFNSKCYYFESSLKTYNNAQTACNSKFGSTGGKLAEPSASAELYTFLYSTATSIVNSGTYWIGIDDLQNDDGVFRYASTLSGRLWSF